MNSYKEEMTRLIHKTQADIIGKARNNQKKFKYKMISNVTD